MGIVLTPLTAAGIADVPQDDAGAASGLVNTAHQLGGSLGLAILISVFASATHGHATTSAPVLTHGVATALTGSTLFLGLALLVVMLVMQRPEAMLARVRDRVLQYAN
jgi:hypothetical protein